MSCFISAEFHRPDIVTVEVSRPGSPEIPNHLQIDLNTISVDDDKDSHRVGRVREKHRLTVTVD